jgi:hypothetical protein
MTRLLSRLSAFLLLGLGSCSQPWPTAEKEQVRELLSRGPQGLECWDSAWMEANKRRNYSYFGDSDKCKKNIKILDISVFNDRVTGVARCRIGSIEAEYKLSVFKSDKRNDYYGGYFCSSAQEKDISKLPVGSVTDFEGAM